MLCIGCATWYIKKKSVCAHSNAYEQKQMMMCLFLSLAFVLKRMCVCVLCVCDGGSAARVAFSVTDATCVSAEKNEEGTLLRRGHNT